jgi:hypothetical protein
MITTKIAFVLLLLLVIPVILIPSFAQPGPGPAPLPSCEEAKPGISCEASIRIVTLLLDKSQYSAGDDLLLTLEVINESPNDSIVVHIEVQSNWLVGTPTSESVNIPSNTTEKVSISFSSSKTVYGRQILQVRAMGTDPSDSSVNSESASLLQVPFKPEPTPILPILIFVLIILALLFFVLYTTRSQQDLV